VDPSSFGYLPTLLKGIITWENKHDQLLPELTALWVGPYRFFFYSNEGNEPPHVHVESAGKVAKVWLTPVAVADSDGYSPREMNKIREIVTANRDDLEAAWYAYFP